MTGIQSLKNLFTKSKTYYNFFCPTCDIFFDSNKYEPKCPLCKREAQIWEIKNIQEEKV